MWSHRGERTLAEPAWVKVAHALLWHGARAGELTQGEFWPFVRGVDGRTPHRNTSSKAVDGMITRGHFMEKDPLRFGRGMGYVLGVSLGAESMRAALFDANGEMVAVGGGAGAPRRHAVEERPRPSQLASRRELLLDRIASVCGRVLDGAFDDERALVGGGLPLLGVAVAWPSPLDRWSKIPIGSSLRDPSWRRADREGRRPQGVGQLVAARLGVDPERSYALNDADAIALGVAFDRSREPAKAHGSGRGSVLVALRIAGGVEAGTVLVGTPARDAPRSPFLVSRLLEGTDGHAGELGHWQVPEKDLQEVSEAGHHELAALRETRCDCGRTRCLASFASVPAFVERIQRSGMSVAGIKEGSRRANVSVMYEAMRNVSDLAQIGAQEDIGRLIGRSLSAPVLMLNPERLVLCGALAVEPVKKGIELERARWQHVHADGLQLHALEGAENKFAAARGAALAAFRGLLYRRFDDSDLQLDRLAPHLSPADVAGWTK